MSKYYGLNLDNILDEHGFLYAIAKKLEYDKKIGQAGRKERNNLANVKAKQRIKALLLDLLIGDDEESHYDYGDATYGDTRADSASVCLGRNELRDELRRKVEVL